MLIFVLALISSTAITIAYLWSSSALVLTYARITAAIATFLLAGEIGFGAASLLWDYLVANSFCPWIMIFRGRSGSVIISEAVYHTNALIQAPSLSGAFSAIAGIGSSLAELVGGPALGVAITAVFIFITYKCAAVIFTKLFNRK